MEKEEQIDGLIAILADMGFDQREMAASLNEHFGKDRFTYGQENTFGRDTVRFEVDIIRDIQSGLYNATNFNAALADGRSHIFKIENDFSDVGTKEAYNLLCGRATLKFHRIEGTNSFRGSWLAVNKGQLQRLPDYDYMAILRSLPIGELQLDITGPKLIYELITGDRAPILLMLKGVPTPAYIEANPEAATVNIYDANGTRVDLIALREKGIIQEAKMALPDRKPRIIKRKPGRNNGRSM
jgi:hypothetical protein